MAQLVAQDNNSTSALVANFFHFVGDFAAGMDSSPRNDPGWARTDGIIGPVQGTGYGVASDGTLYVRGAASTQQPQPQAGSAAPAAAGLVISPGLLLLAVAFFLLRR